MKFGTPSEAAVEMAKKGYPISAARIKARAKRGELPFIMLGSRILVDMDALPAIIAKEQKEDGLVGTSELAQETGLCESAIRRAVKEGWMPCRIIGRVMKFDPGEVKDALVRKMNEEARMAKR